MSDNNGFFDGELLIYNAIKDLVLPEYIYSYETVNTFDHFDVDTPVDKQVAISIESIGYAVPNSNEYPKNRSPRGTTVINPEWRVNVIVPSEQYHVGGVVLYDIIKRVTSIPDNVMCKGLRAISDVHQFHRPEFDSEYVMLHCTFTYDIIL